MNNNAIENLKPEWYILVVNPQHELKVRDKILALSKNPAYKDFIIDAKVPTTKTVSKTGKIKEKVKANSYSQYVFVNMIYDHTNDTAYHAVKVEGVRHILGAPTSMTEEEVEKMLKVMEDEEETEI